MNLAERIAPHAPAEDQVVDGPDTRTFLARLHDEDTRRAESYRIVWASEYRSGAAYYELASGLTLTHWGFGVDAQTDYYTGRIQWWVSLLLGPWSISFRREVPK